MPDVSVRSNRWPQALAWLVLLLLAILILYQQTALGMVGIWSRSETYTHGFVVPLISLWLIWRIRHRLALLPPQPAPTAWVLMLFAAGLWLAGDLVAVNSVCRKRSISSAPMYIGVQFWLARNCFHSGVSVTARTRDCQYFTWSAVMPLGPSTPWTDA